MHLLITRPEEDGAELRAALEEMGHRVSASPLLRIEHKGRLPDLAGVGAMIATSRNAIRALQSCGGAERALALPIYVVGPATGEMARRAGFRTVIEGPGSARDLVPVIAAQASPGATLVHLAGEKLAFDLKAALEAKGFSVRQETLYRSVAAEGLEPGVAAAIRNKEIGGVILMSPRTAMVFAELAIKAGLEEPARDLCHFCLSEAVAQGLADLSPEKVFVAKLTNSQEMLALIARVAPDFA